MIRVAFRKIPANKVDRLKAWLAEAQSREDEVRETFRQETVTHEQAFLLKCANEDILVYVMEVEDPETANRAFQDSILPIDRQHREVMEDVVSETLEPELLYDVRLLTS